MPSLTLSAVLKREHRDIDSETETFIEKLDGGSVQPEPLTTALEALRRHIHREEAFLFPPIREAGMVMPIFVMMREHGALWRTIDALTDLLADGKDRRRLGDTCRQAARSTRPAQLQRGAGHLPARRHRPATANQRGIDTLHRYRPHSRWMGLPAGRCMRLSRAQNLRRHRPPEIRRRDRRDPSWRADDNRRISDRGRVFHRAIVRERRLDSERHRG